MNDTSHIELLQLGGNFYEHIRILQLIVLNIKLILIKLSEKKKKTYQNYLTKLILSKFLIKLLTNII